MKRILRDIRVVGLGQACVDHLGRISAYPEEDSKAEVIDLHIQCGGPASTALVALSRLGISTSFLGSVSDDPFGLQILEDLKKEKVDSTFLKITPGLTSQYAFIAISRENGKRTVFWHRGSVPHLSSSDVDLKPFPDARILHLDGLMIEASMEAARRAKALGLTVVLDGGTMREGSRELASLVDVLIASETFSAPLVGSGSSHEESLRALSSLGPSQVVITLGAKGSIGWDKREIFRQEAIPVQVVDTTGAGDVYHGGYIYGLLMGWDMPKCMLFASAVSAMKCRTVGGRRGIPGLAEAREFMENHPDPPVRVIRSQADSSEEKIP